MNKHKILSLLAVALFALGMSAQAPQTVIADALAKLPAQNSEQYTTIISDLAGTGAEGMKLLTDMLKPAAEVDNSRTEYAIDGIVNYVSAKGRDALCQPIRTALADAIMNCKDNANCAFLLSELNKIATVEEFELYKLLLNDSYLSDYALSGLATIPGIDAQVSDLINHATAPSRKYAYLAYCRKLQDVEPMLMNWAKMGDDEGVSASAISALAMCGTANSLELLKTSGDVDAYLQLLDRLAIVESGLVLAEANGLIENPESSLRCAGLRLQLKADFANVGKNVAKALRSADASYRQTALLHAIPDGGVASIKEIVKVYRGLPASAKIDVLGWIADNKLVDHTSMVCKEVKGRNQNIACAAIASASVLGGEEALEVIVEQVGADGERGVAAEAALRSFNGDIRKGVLTCLKSKKPAVLVPALTLAGERRIAEAYPKVVALTKSTDKGVSEAACKALKGVARADNFDQLCDMLDASHGAATVEFQAAAAAAVSRMSGDEIYILVESRMKKAADISLYYPLLAQSGTHKAVGKLVDGCRGDKHEAAVNALLKVDNTAEAKALFDVASKVKDGERDQLLARFITLTGATEMPVDQRLARYRSALELNPGNKVRKQIIAALDKCPILPAAMLAASYFDDEAMAYTAASSFTNIIAGNAEFQTGDKVRAGLLKAIEIFKNQGASDAVYDVDRVNGILSNWKE